MKLVPIGDEKYKEYRLDAMFDCYKWDPEFEDVNTLARHCLVLTSSEVEELIKLTEELDQETTEIEEFLNSNLGVAKKLELPKKMYSDLKKMSNYDPKKHIRLKRYDFHPTIDNKWAVSEVNSDVPGGFAEASLLPKLAIKVLGEEKYDSIDFGAILIDAIVKKIKKNGTIFFVHCTSYSDDRQVMQYLGDKMESLGYKSIYGAADHLIFKNNEAISILNNNEGKVDCIFRFTPLEWIKDIKPKRWGGYFDTITPSCNHPIAIFAQTKRFPLIFDELEKNGIKIDRWKELLPHTTEVKKINNNDEYLYKPVYGRVGEKISVKEACSEEEYKFILNEVKKHPKKYIAQKKFISKPLICDGISYHICLGSYTVDSKFAGFYARISDKTRIDSFAADIPVLIERGSIDE